MRDLWAAIALGTDQLQPLGGAVPDFEEVVVVSDLPTLQANLQSVECTVMAVCDAKRRSGCRGQGQSCRKGKNFKLSRCMAGGVVTRDHSASQSGLLDERALDPPKRSAESVPGALVFVDLAADVRFGTKRGVEDDAPPLRQTVRPLRRRIRDSMGYGSRITGRERVMLLIAPTAVLTPQQQEV
jgi:hypothetical protein